MTTANIHLPSKRVITVRHDGYLVDPGVGAALDEYVTANAGCVDEAWEDNLLKVLRGMYGASAVLMESNWCSDYDYLVENKDGSALVSVAMHWQAPGIDRVEPFISLKDALASYQKDGQLRHANAFEWPETPQDVTDAIAAEEKRNEEAPCPPHTIPLGAIVTHNGFRGEVVGHTMTRSGYGEKHPEYTLRWLDNDEEYGEDEETGGIRAEDLEEDQAVSA